jgi:hypothetical protein
VTPRGVVTGLGVASPIGIGIGVGQFWKAALVRHPSPTRPRRPTTRRRPRMERRRLTLPRPLTRTRPILRRHRCNRGSFSIRTAATCSGATASQPPTSGYGFRIHRARLRPLRRLHPSSGEGTRRSRFGDAGARGPIRVGSAPIDGIFPRGCSVGLSTRPPRPLHRLHPRLDWSRSLR